MTSTVVTAESHSATLTQAAARDLTDQIRTGMESIYHLIRTAYRGRAWEVLGYGSWDEYVTREFGNLHLRPPLEERRDVVMSLREVGMSTRAIAQATDLSQRTIAREVAAAVAGEPFGSLAEEGVASEPQRVVGLDGKTYQARPERPARATDRPAGSEREDAEAVVPVLEGQSSLDDVLDMPASEFGIEPLDLPSRRAQERDRARRALAAFNGGGAAAVPMLLKVVPDVALLVSPLSGQTPVDDEDLHGVVHDSARCVRALAHVIRSVGHTQGDAAAEIRSTLRDAVDDLDVVLGKLEEVR